MRLFIAFFFMVALLPLHAESNKTSEPGHAVNPESNGAAAGEKAKQVKKAEQTGQQVDGNTHKATGKAIVFRSLAQLNDLIEAGVPALALSLLEAEQKKRPPFTADWYAFEYKRIVIYSAKNDWLKLDDRVSWLLNTAQPGRQITEKIRLWFETRQVIARLRSGQAEKALQQLRVLVWQNNPASIDKSLPSIWRRLIIRAYVALNLDEDAQKALVKYNQDFPAAGSNSDWQLLQARILLKTRRPKQAEMILASMKVDELTDEVRALRMLARLQAAEQAQAGEGKKMAGSILAQMRNTLDGTVLSRSARWSYSYVAYRAAKILGKTDASIQNLESCLSIEISFPVLGEQYTVTPDMLWSLYESEGLRIANDHNLLVGDDKAWQALIEKQKKNSDREAMYLSAALAQTSHNTAIQQQAHAAIVQSIQQRKNGMTLINQLYLHGEHIKDYSILPTSVRYLLVDYALAKGDITKASTLMRSLPQPPEGENAFDWRMRKARVMVLEGDYKGSEELLKQTIAPLVHIETRELDRYIQVVFDFQTVQQHESALALFELIKQDWLNDKLKREIYFWKAESFYALSQFDRAALYYLKSASALEGEENDLWAQSARFKAAGALVKAGIYDDAEKVYKDLLVITASESRKSLIRQSIQKIRLLRGAMQNKQAMAQ